MASVSQNIQQGYDEFADLQKKKQEELANVTEEQALQQVKDLSAGQAERNMAQNEAQRIYQQRLNEGYTSFADIVAGYKKQEADENAEMQRRVEADKAAARTSGYAQLGAALANLYYVGDQNAVNQTHRQFSQDWMKKADDDMREHRNRIDNLRDRQRAIETQLTQMKMGDAGNALQNAQREADQRLQDRMNLSQAQANAKLNPAQMRAQAELEAGKTRLQGLDQAAKLSLQERQLAQSAQQHKDSLALQLAKAGMKKDKDGNFVIDENSAVYKANKRALQDEAHKGKNRYYYTDPDSGELIPIWMANDERDKFIQKAQAELAQRDPDFTKAYMRAMDETSKKSVIFQFAQKDPELRRELSQYSDDPDMEVVPKSDDGNDIDKKVTDFWGSGSR